MGSNPNRTQIEKKVNELSNRTDLCKPVVHSLVEHYLHNCKDKGMDRDTVRDDLMSQFDILDDFLLDRIFRTMDISANTQHLKLDDYVMGMATFLTGSLEDKIRFCFNVYDLNGDGYISREEMFQFLKNSMVTKSHDADDDADEGIKELTELVLKKLDQFDRDGRVCFKDFQAAVGGDKLLLESLGQCLPDEKCRCRYLKTLGDPSMNAEPARPRRKSCTGSKSARASHAMNAEPAKSRRRPHTGTKTAQASHAHQQKAMH